MDNNACVQRDVYVDQVHLDWTDGPKLRHKGSSTIKGGNMEQLGWNILRLPQPLRSDRGQFCASRGEIIRTFQRTGLRQPGGCRCMANAPKAPTRNKAEAEPSPSELLQTFKSNRISEVRSDEDGRIMLKQGTAPASKAWKEVFAHKLPEKDSYSYLDDIYQLLSSQYYSSSVKGHTVHPRQLVPLIKDLKWANVEFRNTVIDHFARLGYKFDRKESLECVKKTPKKACKK
ncbi:hypothetical protein PT974_10423 [Cladobotryum mycophilum]|uniref:Uncharacterized protein n=1 Tax=Cladobotryum mycophilum TaxID=491253 RepID=A0ABR0SB91_9HYPO